VQESGSVQASGSRARGGGLRDGPCTTVEEARRRYGRVIWSGLPAHLSEQERDLVRHNVFVRLFKRSLRSGMPDPVLPVLLGFVDDDLRNLARSRRRNRSAGEPSEDQSAPSTARPDRLVARAEELAELRRDAVEIFDQMDPGDVELIKLSYYDELTSTDIGELLHITAENARKKLSRARAAFGKLFLKKKSASEGEEP
jgi:RNA polymerase sigma factor (sigma-70 family)